MKKYEIRYEKAEGYRNVPITGVIGTLTPHGYVQVECFTEKFVVTEDSNIEIDDNGQPNEVYPEANMILRNIQICFLMRPEAAKNIGQWLINKADEAIPKPKLVK